MNKKLLLFLIPLLFLCPFGVFAKSKGFVFDSNNAYYCVNNSCSKVNLNYLQYTGNTYYNFRFPTQSNTFSVNVLALNSVNNIDVSDYDYMLMNVVTTNNYYFSSAKFTKSGVFGYALTSNYSSPSVLPNSSNLNSSSYSYLIKFDVSDLTTLNGNLLFYFTQPRDNSAISVSENADIYIDLQLYLGKNGDSVSSAIDKNTEENKKINNYLTDDSDATFDSSKLDTVTGLFPEGPVDSLLTIPFKFLSVIVSSLSGSCIPFTCNFVYDTTLTLPCFDAVLWNSSNVDSNLLNYLSLIPSAFILILYFKHLYKKVERATSMETTTDDEWGCV